MLKIGEFARLSQVSLKTLRHYDTLGLLRPAHTDPSSGYRFYDMAQLADMTRILALKDCGFSLEEITQLLQSKNAKAIEDQLNERLLAQQQVVAAEQARLQRLIAHAEQFIRAEPGQHYDIALKRTEPLTLIGLHALIPTRDDLGPFAQEVVYVLGQLTITPVGPLVHIYYSVTEAGYDLFVGAPAAALPPYLNDLTCVRLPQGEQVACTIHRGEYPGLSRAYLALFEWLETSGYQIAGAAREIYHRDPGDSPDPSTYLTEIQLPIQPIEPQSQK